ncbi:hypothetical protein DM01DRAFT_1070123 [Hesseltinella vesiculosa]|uniref:Uncharacterized protein n=1 Tax=Hesseltinella vesiculosa TaxID=101127 RepID=A0A1X2GVD1_9FUNG|nr:hypothetical protein DM01DRAFT_1070123 [Hesseltinella vesiculosa]
MDAPPTPDERTAIAWASFSLMVVSIGLGCFVWQTIQSVMMYRQGKKPIHLVVLFQAVLGILVTFVTLLTPLVEVDCEFRLYFSIIGVNIADIILQGILLWKAYLGNNHSKVILMIGSLPLLGIVAFVGLNITVGKSVTSFSHGVCTTEYPTFIVAVKAGLDFASNAFLSACFILVIYRHYRVLGSSIQRTLIREGLIYCFGVCLSNIATGGLLIGRVLGGSTPVFYTIDCKKQGRGIFCPGSAGHFSRSSFLFVRG